VGNQVTNCSKARAAFTGCSRGGIHWVLRSVKYSVPPQAILWEPVKNRSFSKRAVAALQEVCRKKDVKMYYTGQQSDGWSCGYISVW
jgi:hypothetical protein